MPVFCNYNYVRLPKRSSGARRRERRRFEKWIRSLGGGYCAATLELRLS